MSILTDLIKFYSLILVRFAQRPNNVGLQLDKIRKNYSKKIFKFENVDNHRIMTIYNLQRSGRFFKMKV